MTHTTRQSRFAHAVLLLWTPTILFGAQAARAATIVGSDFLADSLIGIDDTTGVGGAIGPFGANSGFVVGLAHDRNTGTLYGVDPITNPNGGQLVRINPDTGAAIVVGTFGFIGMNGLAFDPNTNTLYGSNSSSSRLFTIDTTTATATLVGSIGFNNVFGLAFDPNTNTLYGSEVTGDRNLLAINTSTGTGTAIGPTGFGQIGGLGFDPDSNTLYGVDDNQNQLVTIDTTTGTGTSVAGTFTLGFAGTQGLAVIAPFMVPEPATIVLFATGGIFLRWFPSSRKRR
jgi:DNA-binding beta-propeller fold protein YncE